MKPPITKIRVHVGSRLVKLEILAKVFPLIAARIAAYSTIPAYIISAPVTGRVESRSTAGYSRS